MGKEELLIALGYALLIIRRKAEDSYSMEFGERCKNCKSISLCRNLTEVV
jgi:hypothetical protein